jgi:hypothetical protein
MHLDAVNQVPNRGGAWTSVRFSLDEGPSGEFWLTLCPPADWDLGEETFIGDLCHAMFGFEKPPLHYLPGFRAIIDTSAPVPAARRPVLRSRRPVLRGPAVLVVPFLGDLAVVQGDPDGEGEVEALASSLLDGVGGDVGVVQVADRCR